MLDTIKFDNSTVDIFGGRGEEKQSHENRKNERKCKQDFFDSMKHRREKMFSRTTT